MFKFFRRNRYELVGKNLPTDEGTGQQAGKTATTAVAPAKAGRYLKYAIGEIVLVVIGILIALQVNNWNESFKEQKLVIQYQERLVEDIEGDLNAVQMRMSYFENVKNYAERSLEFLDKNPTKVNVLDFDSKVLNKALIGFMLAGNKWTYIPGKHTYDDLTSTGKIHLLGSIQERKIVVDYYRELEQKRSYWEVPLEYRVMIRSLIHNDLQEIIIASCESFTGNPIMLGSIENDCYIDLDQTLVNSSMSKILNEEDIYRSLTYVVSHYRTALILYKEQEQSAKDIIQKFRNRG
jgi:hypothetical protein